MQLCAPLELNETALSDLNKLKVLTPKLSIENTGSIDIRLTEIGLIFF